MYSIDTSAILDGWTRYYPPDIFPGIWDKVDNLINSNCLIASVEVFIELEKKDDEVFNWAKERRHMFHPIDRQVQINVSRILSTHERLVDTRKNRSAADPFVIGLAQIYDGIVVTGEYPTNNIEKPNIPDVCISLGIPYISFLEMIRKEGWTFEG